MKTLLFVYNSDSGLWNGVVDYVRKAIAPDTYDCNLCKVISGNSLIINRQWVRFIHSLPYTCKFIYRDEYVKSYPMTRSDIPAVFEQLSDGSLRQLVSRKEINAVTNVGELVEIVKKSLQKMEEDY
jgi:hypothetical protein